MIENLIIGSGFSSHITQQLLLKKNLKSFLISPKRINKIPNEYKYNKFFTLNKIFGDRSISITKNIYRITKNIHIHDRIVYGGNSSIWGGVINLDQLSSSEILFLKKIGINFEKLTFNTTYSRSNKLNVYQMRNNKNDIYNSKDYLNIDINGFVTKIYIMKDYISVKYFDLDFNLYKKIDAKKIYIAVSVIQLIELLKNSDLIHNNTPICLYEHKHNFKLDFNKNFEKKETDDFVIKYSSVGVLKHFFGYQKKLPNFLKVFNNIPIFINQTYHDQINKINGKISNNEINFIGSEKFGDSIHYNNLELNNLRINKFLDNISNKLCCVSMPSSHQKKPGPISNDIVKNIFKIVC